MSLEKVTIRVDPEELERLKKYYPRKGYNWAVRRLITEHLRLLDSKKKRKDREVDLDLGELA